MTPMGRTRVRMTDRPALLIWVSFLIVNNYSKFEVQSNLDYSKCQGPPEFLRIIGSSNFRNRHFSEMFGSFRSVLIYDCISINKNSAECGVSPACPFS